MIVNPVEHRGSCIYSVPAFLDARLEDIWDPASGLVWPYSRTSRTPPRNTLLTWTGARQAKGIPIRHAWVYVKPTDALLDWYKEILGDPYDADFGLSSIDLCGGFDEGLRVCVHAFKISTRIYCETNIAEAQYLKRWLCELISTPKDPP